MQTSGMMSHASYGNYTGFMEVELAAMQDMGYKLDRRNYYGFSVYRDGAVITNTQGYSARDAAGENYLPGVCNTTSLGIGLHVYGSNNTITQQADILTRGTGAAGMRIDGEGNKITLAAGNAIHADGIFGSMRQYAFFGWTSVKLHSLCRDLGIRNRIINFAPVFNDSA